MSEIDSIRARLESASGLAELLARAWDAFDLIRGIVRRSEDPAGELFAAYAMAAASAVQGRNVITAAPSMPPGRAAATTRDPGQPADTRDGPDQLAELASMLGACLRSAALLASHPGDREACELAAAQADAIAALVTAGQ